MASWSAEVLIDPTDDSSEFEVVGGRVAVDFDTDDGDYRNHYRAVLEAAFEAEPRIGQGHAVAIRIG